MSLLTFRLVLTYAYHVEDDGIEPTTYCLQSNRTPNCANPPTTRKFYVFLFSTSTTFADLLCQAPQFISGFLETKGITNVSFN